MYDLIRIIAGYTYDDKPVTASDLKATGAMTALLKDASVRFSDQHAACVIMASKGYPLAYEKGFEINVPEDVMPWTLFAGAKQKDGHLYTSGGRVLGVTAVAGTLKEALNEAYARTERVSFDNAFYRSDIGQRALQATEE